MSGDMASPHHHSHLMWHLMVWSSHRSLTLCSPTVVVGQPMTTSSQATTPDVSVTSTSIGGNDGDVREWLHGVDGQCHDWATATVAQVANGQCRQAFPRT